MSRAAACGMRDAAHGQDCRAIHFLATELVWSSIAKLGVVVRDVINADTARFCCRGEGDPVPGRKRSHQRRERPSAQELPPADLVSFRTPLLVLTGHLLSPRSLRARVLSGAGDRGPEPRECSSLWLRCFPQPPRTRGAAKWDLENHPLPAP